MEISRMLTISTAHITEETSRLLSEAEDSVCGWPCNVSIYDKAEYGWFLWIEVANTTHPNMPKDLAACINFARRRDCDWLCLDCDGETVDLPTYDW